MILRAWELATAKIPGLIDSRSGEDKSSAWCCGCSGRSLRRRHLGAYADWLPQPDDMPNLSSRTPKLTAQIRLAESRGFTAVAATPGPR